MDCRTVPNGMGENDHGVWGGGTPVNYADLMREPFICFAGLTEPEANRLRLHFFRTRAEPFVLGDKVYDEAKVILEDTESPGLQVEFRSYIGYSVRNETFTTWDHDEEFGLHTTGSSACIM